LLSIALFVEKRKNILLYREIFRLFLRLSMRFDMFRHLPVDHFALQRRAGDYIRRKNKRPIWGVYFLVT